MRPSVSQPRQREKTQGRSLQSRTSKPPPTAMTPYLPGRFVERLASTTAHSTRQTSNLAQYRLGVRCMMLDRPGYNQPPAFSTPSKKLLTVRYTHCFAIALRPPRKTYF